MQEHEWNKLILVLNPLPLLFQLLCKYKYTEYRINPIMMSKKKNKKKRKCKLLNEIKACPIAMRRHDAWKLQYIKEYNKREWWT